MANFGIAEPLVTLNEAQAFARVETGEEEAVLAGLIRTASALCESFLNQVVIARAFSLELPASGQWERLQLTPVRSIGGVDALDVTGSATPLPGDGQQVVGSRGAAISGPTAGTTIDAEARAAIDQVLAAMRQHGLIEP